MTKKLDTSRLTEAQRLLSPMGQSVALVQLILHNNPSYPEVIKYPKHVPFLPLKPDTNTKK